MKHTRNHNGLSGRSRKESWKNFQELENWPGGGKGGGGPGNQETHWNSVEAENKGCGGPGVGG